MPSSSTRSFPSIIGREFMHVHTGYRVQGGGWSIHHSQLFDDAPCSTVNVIVRLHQVWSSGWLLVELLTSSGRFLFWNHPVFQPRRYGSYLMHNHWPYSQGQELREHCFRLYCFQEFRGVSCIIPRQDHSSQSSFHSPSVWSQVDFCHDISFRFIQRDGVKPILTALSAYWPATNIFLDLISRFDQAHPVNPWC